MNKYILSALVVPVAFMGTTAAQAKTAALKARVNHVHASAKKITGKTVRGAHIKLTRGTVTYGVAKADRHGHFVLKLKHKIKGGWKYQVSISKAGYKTKSIGFKVKGLTKKAAKIKPVVPTSPAPTTPAAPQAPAAQSSAPKPTTVGSQADVEADKVSNDIARLNLQMDNFQAGRQTMTPFWRTSIDSQLQQLLNRIDGLATGNLRTDLLNALRNAWTNLHQRFLNFLAGLNRQILGGSTPAKSTATIPSVTKKASQPNTLLIAEKIKALQDSNQKSNEVAADLDVPIYMMHQNLEKNNFPNSSKQQNEGLQNLNQGIQTSESRYDESQKLSSDFSKLLKMDVLGLMKQQTDSLKKDYEQLLQSEKLDETNYRHILENMEVTRDEVRKQISQNNAQIQNLQSQQASQTK